MIQKLKKQWNRAMKSGADSLKNSTKLMNLYQDSSRKKEKGLK